MKKALFLLSLILLTLPVLSQGRKYTRAMQSVIEEMHNAADPGSELELLAGSLLSAALKKPMALRAMPCLNMPKNGLMFP